MKTLTERLNIVDGDELREGSLVINNTLDIGVIAIKLNDYLYKKSQPRNVEEIIQVAYIIADFGSKIKLKHNGIVTVWFDKE